MLKSILKYTFGVFNKLFPPIKFKKKFFKKELEPTSEDLDKWAEAYIEKHDKARRKYKNGN